MSDHLVLYARSNGSEAERKGGLGRDLFMIIQARSRGRGRGGSSPPPEIFRLELNSATEVDFFLLKWTAVNGS